MSLESKAKTTLEIENQAKELGFKAWSCKYADIIEAKKNQENFDNQKWVLLEFAQKLEAEIKQVKQELWEQKNLPHKGAVIMMKQINDAQKILDGFPVEMLEPLDGTTMYRLNKWLKSLRLALSEKVAEK